jgi:hypothetical protein
MWLAYSSRKPGLAVMKTFGFVVFLPWMFCSGFPVWMFLARFGGLSPMINLFHPLVSVGINLLFIYWGRERLRRVWLGQKSMVNLLVPQDQIFRP